MVFKILMGKIDIDNFIEVYVSTALDLIGKKGEMPLSEFESIVREGVSEAMRISEEDVLYLHHSFHWTFFRGENPPLSYIQAEKKGDVLRVGLNGTSVDESRLIKYILDEYTIKRRYLTTRVKQL